MIILKWNIRVLGDLDKRAKVRDFIHLYGFDVISLQETKLLSPTFHLFCSIGGVQINEWVVLDSIGASRGQLIG